VPRSEIQTSRGISPPSAAGSCVYCPRDPRDTPCFCQVMGKQKSCYLRTFSRKLRGLLGLLSYAGARAESCSCTGTAPDDRADTLGQLVGTGLVNRGRERMGEPGVWWPASLGCGGLRDSGPYGVDPGRRARAGSPRRGRFSAAAQRRYAGCIGEFIGRARRARAARRGHGHLDRAAAFRRNGGDRAGRVHFDARRRGRTELDGAPAREVRARDRDFRPSRCV
jgi:hypothetical protein